MLSDVASIICQALLGSSLIAVSTAAKPWTASTTPENTKTAVPAFVACSAGRRVADASVASAVAPQLQGLTLGILTSYTGGEGESLMPSFTRGSVSLFFLRGLLSA